MSETSGLGRSSPAVQVGDLAPEVLLSLADGRQVSLTELRGDKGLVLFFYPKDNTPVCTKQACSFRDAYQQFLAAGVEVVGISSDSASSHQQFADRHRLPFPLASDRDGALRKAFGVPKTLGIFPGRVTYLIDPHGIVQMVFSAQLASDEHVQRALAAIERFDR
jgi:thioredoxin-dependent peroxiredoxin